MPRGRDRIWPGNAALNVARLAAGHERQHRRNVPGRDHGLRKAGATIAANNGATAHQLMAIFGWDTLKMAEQYTRAADQQRLAEAAIHMLMRENK